MSDSSEFKINMNRVAVVVGVIAGLLGLAGAWFILPYRMDAAERTQASFEAKVERRFEANEADAKMQRDILIRIDENVKALKETQRTR